MKHGNGKNLGIKQDNYHLHGEVLANFPNFGLISKIDPNEQCLASFLGLAQTAGIQICIWSKHSAKKGHVPNQSLYKGWEQSFSPFFPDQKMDIIFCQDGQFIKCRN